MRSFTAVAADRKRAYRLFKDGEGLVLMSDYESKKAPRGPQKRSAPIHMGISMFATEEAARAKNDDFDGKLGDHFAVFELTGSLGVWWAQTFTPDHMTVWGNPRALENCIREVHPV